MFGFFRRKPTSIERAEPAAEATVVSLSARLQALRALYIHAVEIDRTSAAGSARHLLLAGCRDGLAPDAGVLAPRDEEVTAWDSDGRVSHTIAPLALRPTAWAEEFVARAVTQCFDASGDPVVIADSEIDRLVGLGYCAGREVARRFPDVARRWLDADSTPSASPPAPLWERSHNFDVIATTRDAGIEALDRIYSDLMIDEEWTVREPRAFTWVGHRLGQRIAATPLVESLGTSISLVSIETLVVTDVAAPQDEVERLLSMMNVWAVGSGYTYLPHSRSVVVRCHYHVHDQVLPWRAVLLGNFAILQLILAESDADQLAATLGGSVSEFTHPTSGSRPRPDDMMNVLGGLFMPEGQKPSRFADDEEMQAVLKSIENSPFASFGSSSDGISIEVAFGEHSTSLIRLRTDIAHPILGNGMLVTTALPLDLPDGTQTRDAATIQRAQSDIGQSEHSIGGWAVHSHDRRSVVGSCTFIPNFSFGKGLARDIAGAEINRMIWARERYFPGTTATNAWGIIERRLALQKNAGGAEEHSYAGMYEQLNRYLAESASMPELERIAGRISLLILAQLAYAEQVYQEAGVTVRDIRHLILEPWPLGYIVGAAGAASLISDHAPGGVDGTTIVSHVLRNTLGQHGVSIARDLEAQLLQNAEMTEGLNAAVPDLMSVTEEQPFPSALFDWLVSLVVGDPDDAADTAGEA